MDSRLKQGFTDLYCNYKNEDNTIFEIPKDLGEGYSKKLISSKNLEVCYNDITCKKSIQMSGQTKGDVYILTTFSGEKIEWLEKNTDTYLEMKSGEAILYKIKDIREISEYKAKCNYSGLTMVINPSEVYKYLPREILDKNIFKSVKNDLKIKKFILPTESRLIIEQIKNCPYNCYLKDMYLEAKVFELFSICLNNMMEQNIDKTIDSGLSKTEIESIYRAREILDSSMDTHITIRQISKLVYLNEYKLKTGFKEIFGKPLYAYKLDKRMELARELLTMGNTDINKIASMVGYASGDSFSKAFHKRYGVRPIEYL